MNFKKYATITSLILVLTVMSCRDESLYPLPYNDRSIGAYLRMYKITSNLYDLNDINTNAGANSGFDVIWEAIDEENGDNLEEVRFYASFRRGTGLTSEVLVKTVSGTAFSAVPAPTYSVYKRAPIRVTYAETASALAAAPAPPATWTSGSVGITFPATLAAADQFIYRWIIRLKDGREFQVNNAQGTEAAKATETPNITTGQFYNAPGIYTMVVRSLVANSWVGTYSLTQTALWSPNHSAQLHSIAFPTYLNEVLFPNQTVTLSVPAGGLSSEREFTVSYRGINTTMRINLENGTTWVPLQNSTVTCTTDRQVYWCMPTAGSFAPGSFVMPAGLPQVTTANRGTYNTAIAGTTAGNVITIGVDDDADEYGRRNGYCTWVRRVFLTLTKQ
jgi:hypothetical protein